MQLISHEAKEGNLQGLCLAVIRKQGGLLRVLLSCMGMGAFCSEMFSRTQKGWGRNGVP